MRSELAFKNLARDRIMPTFQKRSAAGGTRTRTGFPPADFKSAASAISPQRHREPRMYLNHPKKGSGNGKHRIACLASIPVFSL